MYFKNRLKALRKSKDLTQPQLAAALGLGRSTISMYERGQRHPDFATLELIADFFNVPIASLLSDSDRGALENEALDLLNSLPDDLQKVALEQLRSLSNLSDSKKNQ